MPLEKTLRQKPKTHWLIPLFIGFMLASVLASMAYFYQNQNKPKIQTLTRDSVIAKVQTLNRLQTVAYNIDTIITSHKDGSWQKLWQDEQKGLFVAHGRVQAGVDLNQLKPENVLITEVPSKTPNSYPTQPVTITLPPAQVFETYLDNVEVYDIKTGLFGAMPTDPQLFNDAQTVGKQQVLAKACQSDILKLANDNAQKQVQALFDLANPVMSSTTRSSNVEMLSTPAPVLKVTVQSTPTTPCM